MAPGRSRKASDVSLTIVKRKDDGDKKKPQAKPEPRRSPVALPRWHKELEREQRTKHDFDDLWRAACYEMSALEAPEGGPGAKALWKAADKLLEKIRKKELFNALPSR